MSPLRSVCVFCGSRPGSDPAYAADAQALGRLIATAGWRLVYGAGDVGLMGEVARATLAAGGATMGVIPVHLMQREQGRRDLSSLVVTEDMHERKKVMFMNSDAIVVLPGGAGTLDEFFEVLTWRQIGLHKKPIFLLNTAGYWRPLISLIDHTVTRGFADASLTRFFQTVPDIGSLEAALASTLIPGNSDLKEHDLRDAQQMQTTETGDTAEMHVSGNWRPVHVSDVLSWPNRPALRCRECHGSVRAHKESNNGMRAHFEHLQAHEGCSRSRRFSGQTSRHPHAME